MISNSEIAANISFAASVWLAARNSVHTWWIGILGCVLFAWIFFKAQLYADVTLQVFFIATSLVGWWHWLHGARNKALPVRKSTLKLTTLALSGAIFVTVGYGTLLHNYTDAFSPFLDSAILAFSVLGQFLLMWRRIESWYAWLIVNTIAVPLYSSRELYLTAVLYGIFWLNAWYGLYRWRREIAL